MKVKLCILAVCVLLICLFFVCGNVFGVQRINWKMTSFIVDASGNVSDGPEIKAVGDIREFDNYTGLGVSFEISGDFRYSFGKISADVGICREELQVNLGDYVTGGYVYDKVENEPAWASWALNTEKGYFVAWFGEEYGQYLVASKDPNVKPKDILEHFSFFLETVVEAKELLDGE